MIDSTTEPQPSEGRPREGRRARGGGGAARRAERTATKLEAARYITRKVPNFEILTAEAIEVIEANAETVLQEIGVNFVDNPVALERWRQAGADVQGERVRIPRGLARQLCATAPSEFTQHARNPERSVVIGGKNCVLAPVYGPPFVRDLDGGRRYATLADPDALGSLAGAVTTSGISIVRPDAYGQGGQVVAFVGAGASARGLERALGAALAAHSAAEKDAREHVRAGKHAGIAWTSKLPVTDPGPARR